MELELVTLFKIMVVIFLFRFVHYHQFWLFFIADIPVEARRYKYIFELIFYYASESVVYISHQFWIFEFKFSL